MSRNHNKLSDARVRAAAKQGRHSDGGGLYLSIGPTGGKSWTFVWVKDGRKREMGLGAYPAVSLAQARGKAAECRASVAEGRDPIAERDREQEPTFGAVAEMTIVSMTPGWKNAKTAREWRYTFATYTKAITHKRVSQIETGDVLAVLKPLWQARPALGSRVRARIETVIDYAKARGWRPGSENPARWRGHLANLLSKKPKFSARHHAAMPYGEVPAFVERLRQRGAMTGRCLEFLILTAVRSGEARGARWSEIDIPNAVWTIPAARMKAGKEHRVPLSRRAMQIVTEMATIRSGDHVFPGLSRSDRGLSDAAFAMLLRRMRLAGEITAHGFRSAFRDWCGDMTEHPREIAEAALAHRAGDATEIAYRRSDALERRRRVMQDWSDYIGNLVNYDTKVVRLT